MSDVDLKKYVDDRLASMRDRPSMWGCLEAIELQAVTLIEVEHFMRTGVADRQALDTFIKTKSTQGFTPMNRPLFMHFKLQTNPIVYDVESFSKALYEVCRAVRETLANE